MFQIDTFRTVGFLGKKRFDIGETKTGQLLHSPTETNG